MTGHAEQAAAWIYRGIWGVLVGLFRVPKDPPALPVGAGQRHDSFQPGPGYLSYMKFHFWVILVLIDIALTIGWAAATIPLLYSEYYVAAAVIAVPALAIIVLPDIVAYIAIHLRYDTTWYVLTDRSLRIRRGILIMHEMTITFENVQNVTVSQGPLQRWFGIGSVVVQTAGGGGGDPHHARGATHQGVIEGIGNAAEVRDLIMARVRASVSAGLGDELMGTQAVRQGSGSTRAAPGRVARAAPSWTPAHVAALRAIRDELRALPRALPRT